MTKTLVCPTSGTSKGTVAEDPNDDWSWTILPSSKSPGNYKISGITFFKKNRISGIRLAKIRPDPDFGINFIENRQINSLFMLFKSKISFFSIRKKVVILTTKKTNYLTFRLGKKFRVCKFQFFSLFYRNKYFFETGYPAGYPESDYNRIYGRISGSGFFYNRIIRNPASNSLFTTLFLIFSIGSDEEEGFSDDSYQDPDYKIQTVEPSSDSEDDNMGVVNRYNIVIPFCFLVMGVAQIKVSI